MIGILLSIFVSVSSATQFSFEVQGAAKPMEIIEAIETLGIKIMATSETDTVDGYVVISSRKDGTASVKVVLYEKGKARAGKKVGHRAHNFRKDKKAKGKLKTKIEGAGK